MEKRSTLSIENKQGLELVKLPEDKKTVGCKWVFNHKDGSIESHKSRLVAKSYSQQHGLDYPYDENFSPAARFESLQMLLALAVQDGLHVYQLDMTKLNGKLEEEVYMEGLVCQLKHSLYDWLLPDCWRHTYMHQMLELHP